LLQPVSVATLNVVFARHDFLSPLRVAQLFIARAFARVTLAAARLRLVVDKSVAKPSLELIEGVGPPSARCSGVQNFVNQNMRLRHSVAAAEDWPCIILTRNDSANSWLRLSV
jgi:hypothetical protein